jgi:hypothetical protein
MKLTLFFILFFISPLLFPMESETELHWPREILEDDYIITIYQPQLETLKDNILEGRMALSIKDKNDEIIFGVMWFKAVLLTHLETRTAIL